MTRWPRALLSAYVRSVLTPLEWLTASLGKEHLFESSISPYRDKTIVDGGMTFDASHTRLVYRATHFARQEPDLLRWIEEKYGVDDVFYDVGANIGYFSIFAALKTRVRVYAFEPESLTFASLNRNIFYNRVSDHVVGLPVALTSTESISFLNLKKFVPGNAYNTLGSAVDFRGMPFEAEYRQGSIGMSLDYLLAQFAPPAPNHIKIDVDGNEADIIRGMPATLLAKDLRTVCIELTPERPEHQAILKRLDEAGFTEDLAFVNRDRDAVGTRNFYFSRE